MSLRNRTQWGDNNYDDPSDGGSPARWVPPRPTPVVIGLMITCAVIFIAATISREFEFWLLVNLSLTFKTGGEIWRFITFQFLHADARHIMWNLVGLYFFGPPLERAWGTRRFTAFYLFCGVFGGICFLIMTLILPMPKYLVGASGGIMGCLMACAILYPKMIFIIVPIRWVAAFYVILYILSILHDNRYEDAAHLGGMVAAAGWILSGKILNKLDWGPMAIADRVRQRARQRQAQRLAKLQQEADRILDKVHEQGIQSLTEREKKTLQDATRLQRQHDRQGR